MQFINIEYYIHLNIKNMKITKYIIFLLLSFIAMNSFSQENNKKPILNEYGLEGDQVPAHIEQTRRVEGLWVVDDTTIVIKKNYYRDEQKYYVLVLNPYTQKVKLQFEDNENNMIIYFKNQIIELRNIYNPDSISTSLAYIYNLQSNTTSYKNLNNFIIGEPRISYFKPNFLYAECDNYDGNKLFSIYLDSNLNIMQKKLIFFNKSNTYVTYNYFDELTTYVDFDLDDMYLKAKLHHKLYPLNVGITRIVYFDDNYAIFNTLGDSKRNKLYDNKTGKLIEIDNDLSIFNVQKQGNKYFIQGEKDDIYISNNVLSFKNLYKIDCKKLNLNLPIIDISKIAKK
jgi:hypothetical protein